MLIVEPRAHYASGHFPNRCAELATAYADLGFRVELLTSLGWARDHEHPHPPFTVRRWRRWARWLRTRFHDPWLFTLLVAVEARACAQRMVPRPDVVVLLAWDEIPSFLAATVPRHERWLVNQFRRASDLPRSTFIETIGRARERRRRAAGGAVRIVVAHDDRRETWAEVAPFLDPVVAPVAGVRDLAPLPEARVELGLPIKGKLALLFGESVLKRREIVLDAFATFDDWTLILGGAVADGVAPAAGVLTFGVVDDATRDRLFAAVDLVVLSFAPGYRNESGTLMDAIAAGTPVVCCDDAAVAHTIVEPFELGTTFRAGDAVSLADAVREAPSVVDPAHLASARRELSNRAVARRQLLAMGIVVGHA